MLPVYTSRSKGVQITVEILRLGRVKNSLSGSSWASWSQPFSTYGGNINLVHYLGSHSGILKEKADYRKGLSSLGIFSRVLSVPSLSGASCQLCIYNTNYWLSESNQSFFCTPFQQSRMAACSSLLGRAPFGSSHLNSLSGGTVKFVEPVNFPHTIKIINYDIRLRVPQSLRSRQQTGHDMLYRRFWSDTKRSWSSSLMELKGKDFHSSCSSSYSAGAAHDITFDGPVREELDNSAASSDQKPKLGARKLKLFSGSCYLPHPAKEETGGEDAHFICVDEQVIGVADGVGGWADVGVNAGLYSRELISHSVDAIQQEPKGLIDPARVLEKAHSITTARGSSTACIIALTEQGIHAVNLGDSGFIVVRDGCITFRSPVQQHDFNFTYQLANDSNGDLPSSAQVFNFPVAPGDVIIAGTDGLFDNLYNNEINAVVVHAIRAGFDPQVTAQKIAALARQRALDKNRQTPFSTAAQDAGYRYYGGKLDDVTVVVSYITASDE